MNLFSKTNFSLMNKIILAFVGYVTLILLVFSIIVIMIDRGQVKGISDGYSQVILDDRNQMVREWLSERIKDIQVLALTEEVRSMDGTSAIPFLKEAMSNHDDLYGRYFIIGTDGTMADTLGIETVMREKFDFTEHSDMGIEVVVSVPKQDETFKQPTIDIFVPIDGADGVVGILGSTVLLSDLSNLVSESFISNNGYAWIIDNEGTIISHINEDMLAMSLMPEEEGELSDIQKFLGRMTETGSGEDRFVNESDEKEYVIYNRIDGPADWFVIVSLHQSDIYNTVGNLIGNLAVILLVVVALSAVVSWYLAKDITSPIQSLIEVTNKFTTGIKGIRARVDSNDEIGALSQSFNNMADTIVAHTDNLEELIKERTSTLADLNYQIVSRNKELGTMNEELEKTNNTLHALASTDMLTGLYNRHEFQRELQKTMELVNSEREENFALLFIDLDNFKYYNDTFSHEIGDFLLQNVSDILSSKVRSNDIVGRYGGDEFVVLLREGDYDVAKTIAERIHKTILDHDGFKKELQKKLHGEVKIMGKNKLSSSIGIVRYMKSMKMHDADDLLALADATMYKAKKAGKSRVVVG